MTEPISQKFVDACLGNKELLGYLPVSGQVPVRHTQFIPDNNPIEIIGHHSGGTDTDPLADTSHHTADIVRAWHLQKGWEDVGYHIITEKESREHPDGRLVLGRPFNFHGAHCFGMNTKSIGWMVTGNFDRNDIPSEKQQKLMREFYAGNLKKVWVFNVSGRLQEIDNPIKNLLSLYPNLTPDKVFPHRKYQNKTCFGMNLKSTFFADVFRQAIEENQGNVPAQCADVEVFKAQIEAQRRQMEAQESTIVLLIKYIRDLVNGKRLGGTNSTMQTPSFSMTQSGNVVAFIMFMTELFKINVTNSEVETVVKAVIGVVGVIISWVGRYRKGDLTLAGFRKRSW